MRTLVAMLLMTTCAMAQEPVQTCTGRVKVHVDKGNYWGGGRLLHVGIEKKDEGCGQFYTVPNSLNGKQILQTCSIGSSCRV